MTEARLRLVRTDGIGPVTYRRLMDRYGTAELALEALPELSGRAGRAAPPVPPSPGSIRREMDATARLGGQFVFLDDPAYPRLLALLGSPPPVLAVLGDVALLSARSVALVGARNASANGQRMAEALAAELGMEGVCVVSGMARGIDAAAHRGALRTGRTVACIAGGLNVAYPAENAALQDEVAHRGAVITTAPLGTAPQQRHFPRRNRIIVGLSLGVVVVEAAPHSGSLMTARLAQEASREVFAVPGSPLDPRCKGSNALIRSEGAMLTECAADVLAGLSDRVLAERMERGAASLPGFAEAPSPLEDPVVIRLKLLELLGPDGVQVDDLVRRCQFSAHSVQGAVQEMEGEGLVQILGGQVSRIVDQGI